MNSTKLRISRRQNLIRRAGAGICLALGLMNASHIKAATLNIIENSSTSLTVTFGANSFSLTSQGGPDQWFFFQTAFPGITFGNFSYQVPEAGGKVNLILITPATVFPPSEGNFEIFSDHARGSGPTLSDRALAPFGRDATGALVFFSFHDAGDISRQVPESTPTAGLLVLPLAGLAALAKKRLANLA